MKKVVLIFCALMALSSCQKRDLSGYGTGSYPIVFGPAANTTYYPNTNYYPNRTYYPNTNYYPNYSYPGYATPYYNSPYYNRPTWYDPRYYPGYWPSRITYANGYRNYCALNVAIDSENGSVIKTLSGKNLRAETIGQKTEIQYGSEKEKFNLFTNEKGKTFVSGKMLVDGELIKIDSKKQKCKSSKSVYKDDHTFELAKFNCTDGDLQIKAEALIPKN